MAAQEELTETQAEVLRLLQEGKKPKEIAEMRGHTVNSVYTMAGRLRQAGHLPAVNGKRRGRKRTKPEAGTTPAERPKLEAVEPQLTPVERARDYLEGQIAALDASLAQNEHERANLEVEMTGLLARAEELHADRAKLAAMLDAEPHLEPAPAESSNGDRATEAAAELSAEHVEHAEVPEG